MYIHYSFQKYLLFSSYSTQTPAIFVYLTPSTPWPNTPAGTEKSQRDAMLTMTPLFPLYLDFITGLR
jgi:hypothetical protein